MRRRRSEGSLELLLDTITNTFGGILFIAILVALLLRSSAPEEPAADERSPMTAVEQARLEVRVGELTDRIADLRASAPDLPTAAGGTPGREREHELEKLLSALGETLEARARISAETVALQREAAETRDEAASLETATTSAHRKLEAARAELDNALAESAELARLRAQLDAAEQPSVIEQTARLPRLHRSDKRQVGLYIRFRKIYMMHVWRDGERSGPNPRDFVVTPGHPQTARPRPDAGMPITPATIDREIGQLLAPFPPAQWVVATVVFEDSFDAFQVVKQALIRAGYEYGPIPLKPGEGVNDWGGTAEGQ